MTITITGAEGRVVELNDDEVGAFLHAAQWNRYTQEDLRYQDRDPSARAAKHARWKALEELFAASRVRGEDVAA